MKNISTLFAVTFLFAIIFSSCKKQTVTNTIYIKDTIIRTNTTVKDTVHGGSIVGFWPGTYGSAGNYPSMQFSFLFRSDGTVKVYADGADTTSTGVGETGEGSYTLVGYSVATQFNLSISGSFYLFSTYGKVDSSFVFYEGTIGQGLNASGLYVDIAHKQ